MADAFHDGAVLAPLEVNTYPEVAAVRVDKAPFPLKYGIEPVPTADQFWPVPPYWVAIVVPCHVPVATVPKVVTLVVPAHVERAVFSTLFNPTSAAVKVGEEIKPRLLKAVRAFPEGWAIGEEL
jgi:hypothetical protein